MRATLLETRNPNASPGGALEKPAEDPEQGIRERALELLGKRDEE